MMSIGSWLGLSKSEEEKAAERAEADRIRREAGASAFSNPESGGLKNQFQGLANAAGTRAAPGANAAMLGKASLGSAATGTAKLAADSDYRNAQTDLIRQLQLQATGGGPSMAGLQLKQGLEGTLQGQMAAAASAKGVNNPALAMRNLGLQGTQAAGAVNQAAAAARIQEMLGAQGLLGNVATGARGQDQALAMFNATQGNQFGLANMQALNQFGLANMSAENQFKLAQAGFNQQTGLANLQSQLAMTGMNDADRARYMSMLQSQSEADRAARMAAEQFKAGGAIDWAKLTGQAHAADTAEGASYMAALGQLAGMAVGASDENQKTGVAPAAAGIEGFLKGYKYMSDKDEAKKAAAAKESKPSVFSGPSNLNPESKDFDLGAWQAKNLPETERQSLSMSRPVVMTEGPTGNAVAIPGSQWQGHSALMDPAKNPAAFSKFITSMQGNKGIEASEPAPEMGGMPLPGDIGYKPQMLPSGSALPNTAMPASHTGKLGTVSLPQYTQPQGHPMMSGFEEQPLYAGFESASDEQQKAGIGMNKTGIEHFMGALKPYKYHYKDPSIPFAGEGEHYGVMAQDLEKAGPVGKSMVMDTPTGKVVDFGKAGGVTMAALADLNERLSRLESRRKGAG